jgi:hypothetical protein
MRIDGDQQSRGIQKPVSFGGGPTGWVARAEQASFHDALRLI